MRPTAHQTKNGVETKNKIDSRAEYHVAPRVVNKKLIPNFHNW